VRILKWFVVLALFVLVVVAGALFTIQNEATVPLDLLVVQLPARSVALWVIVAFIVGGLVGLGLSILTIVRLKGESILLRRRLQRGKNSQARLRQHESNQPAAKS
jgi:lipopolysaccharide assembly protein A